VRCLLLVKLGSGDNNRHMSRYNNKLMQRDKNISLQREFKRPMSRDIYISVSQDNDNYRLLTRDNYRPLSMIITSLYQVIKRHLRMIITYIKHIYVM
jgi:protoheme ferro-lyase